MEQQIVISIAKDFGRYPAGRYLADGPYSGQAFREKLLVPALNRSNGAVCIELDGARGLASSFLEEAFGGLVREGFDPQTLLERLQLQSDDPTLVQEIKEYISSQSSAGSH
ncbi:MAG: STAS-like domain-containing protein [Thiobacillaceae bacterium]